MRRTCWLGAIALVVMLWAPAASAQYANHSLGLGLGFIGLSGGDQSSGYGPTAPLWLEGHQYIENGFDLYIRVAGMLVYSSGNADTSTKSGLVLATGGDLGVRYLFMEETIRPWVGLYLTGIAIFGATTVGFVGPGAAAGLDYFATDSMSIGIRAFFNVYVMINQAATFGPGAAANIAFYF